MKSTLVVFGMPGVGKGTRLSNFLDGRDGEYELMSVGNMLRAARAAGSELGLKAASYMDQGLLVPGEIVNGVVLEGMKNADKNLITDGFPRTIEQAKAMLEADIIPSVVIELVAPREVVLDRALNRIVCKKCGEAYTLNDYRPPKVEGICDKCGVEVGRRKDDEEETVLERFAVYEQDTLPLLKVLEEAGVEICTIDTTASDVDEQFKTLMLKYS